MKFVSSSDIFLKGAPVAAGVPFEISHQDARTLGALVRPATNEEIAAHEGICATHAANAAADRRNGGSTPPPSVLVETAQAAPVTEAASAKPAARARKSKG